jgi:P-type E1-E2 ATPase
MHTLLIPIICLGLIRIAIDSFQHIRRGEYSLDYIAAAAMMLSLVTGEYIAGAVIAVMFLGGEALERYATRKASSSLSQLANTIPKTCAVRQGDTFIDTPLQSIRDGSIILVKHQEIVPLDGVVVSPRGALLDTANLTGESDVVEVIVDTSIKSGVINKGEAFEMRVTGDMSTSTYHKIVEVVEKARTHPARMVRLSARANAYFTGLSVALATFAYVYTGELGRVLLSLIHI